MAELKVGDHVEVTGKGEGVKGEVAFVGTTSFSQGKWIGKMSTNLSVSLFISLFISLFV